MTQGPWFGFDFGTKRIGVATGQLITASASPLTIIKATKGFPDWQALDELVKRWRPAAAVVGLPVNMDGEFTKITRQAEGFANALAGRYPWPVHRYDERLTSFAAREDIQSRQRRYSKADVDKLAAVIILESFFQQYSER